MEAVRAGFPQQRMGRAVHQQLQRLLVRGIAYGVQGQDCPQPGRAVDRDGEACIVPRAGPAEGAGPSEFQVLEPIRGQQRVRRFNLDRRGRGFRSLSLIHI